MKAQNLTISVPYSGCDKDCPYCVSKMTGYIDTNELLIESNLDKVRKIAEIAQVSSILLTGKGEPCLNSDWIEKYCELFRNYPIELQTNGLKLLKEVDLLSNLHDAGLDVLALSLDKLEDFETFQPLFAQAKLLDLVLRVTLNITKLIPIDTTAERILGLCREAHIDQLSFRQITIPRYVEPRGKECQDVMVWIHNNVGQDQYSGLVEQVTRMDPRVIRKLPYGATVYDVNGIAVTWFDYCIQDQHGVDDIRSLIFQEDGHLYTAWNSPASILF